MPPSSIVIVSVTNVSHLRGILCPAREIERQAVEGICELRIVDISHSQLLVIIFGVCKGVERSEVDPAVDTQRSEDRIRLSTTARINLTLLQWTRCSEVSWPQGQGR